MGFIFMVAKVRKKFNGQPYEVNVFRKSVNPSSKSGQPISEGGVNLIRMGSQMFKKQA